MLLSELDRATTIECREEMGEGQEPLFTFCFRDVRDFRVGVEHDHTRFRVSSKPWQSPFMEEKSNKKAECSLMGARPIFEMRKYSLNLRSCQQGWLFPSFILDSIFKKLAL